MDDSEKVRRILRKHKTIAVVGLSAQWHRPSSFAAKYMKEHGYRVIPVNSMYDSILGEKCYKRLADIPDPVDVVDCFRKSEEIPAIAGGVLVHHCHAAQRTRDGGKSNQLDRGQPVVLEGWANESASLARVKYRGTSWDALVAASVRPAPGTTLYIEGQEGNTLVVATA